MNTNIFLSGCVVVWSLTFLAGLAYGEPKQNDNPPPATGEMFGLQKPVSCTRDDYDEIKEKLKTSHGEIGVVRFNSADGTVVELVVNPSTGTSTLLEFLGESGITCIISSGGGTEYNTNLFQGIKPPGVTPGVST